ncbi:helix-turn-helix domain-containing protein [Prosthecobacter sp.]|uniref:AraC family transcriptional regulator n=1 Tax=Prosthecobacter sp. TaxID=1965333 RepID=UPI002ABD049D|nr:helix-turn-helix domain-containing protein [Prosthecobacter sp.]MDZ4401995.1 helix-turn-helix domain-containing protein [Prosthecobacter sp.]
MPKTIPADAWRSLRHEWLWVYRGAVPTCDVWSAEIPVPPGVFFVERGEVRIRADGNEMAVSRGQAFFSAPGLRRHWFAKNTRLLSVGFRIAWPDGTPLFRSGLNFATKSPKLRLATLELFRRVHRGKKSVGFRDAVMPKIRSLAGWAAHEAEFAAWFVVFIETLRQLDIQPESRAPTNRRRVDQLVAWLNSRPLDQITPTLPSEFPLGVRRADQVLQQHLGMGLRSFLERRRLDAARERIIADQDTLKETAFALGFRHASHFTAWFRRHTGLSPSAYREGGGAV